MCRVRAKIKEAETCVNCKRTRSDLYNRLITPHLNDRP